MQDTYGYFGQYGPWDQCSGLLPPSPRPKLQQWFGRFEPHLEYVLSQNCSAEYDFYLTHHGTPDGPDCAIAAVVSCILANYDQLGVANMQSGAVILGILPTVLSLLSVSPVEVGVLALRRPLLAFLLGAGSPGASPFRTFDYRVPAEILQFRPKSRRLRRPSGIWTIFVSAAQYLLAVAATINVAIISWKLGIRTVLSWAPQSSEFPLIWAFLSVAIHIGGAMSVFLRIKLTTKPTASPDSNTSPETTSCPSKRATLLNVAKLEVQPSSTQPPVELSLREESDIFIFFCWLTSVGIVLHIVYGTLTLSGTLFISSIDAVGVAGRYLASTLVCKIVLAYEMNGMRQVVDVRDRVDEQTVIERK